MKRPGIKTGDPSTFRQKSRLDANSCQCSEKDVVIIQAMHVVAQCGPSLLPLQGLFIDTMVTRLLSHMFSFILHPLVRHNENFWTEPKLQGSGGS